jgi:hypothetical protein
MQGYRMNIKAVSLKASPRPSGTRDKMAKVLPQGFASLHPRLLLLSPYGRMVLASPSLAADRPSSSNENHHEIGLMGYATTAAGTRRHAYRGN